MTNNKRVFKSIFLMGLLALVICFLFMLTTVKAADTENAIVEPTNTEIVATTSESIVEETTTTEIVATETTDVVVDEENEEFDELAERIKDWLKNLNFETLRQWIYGIMAYLGVNAFALIMLALKIIYDSVQKKKAQIESKENQSEAEKKQLEILTNIQNALNEAINEIKENETNLINSFDADLKQKAKDGVNAQLEILNKSLEKLNNSNNNNSNE